MKYEKYTVEDVKRSSARKLYSVISCFAGGGGSSIGYKLSGGNVLLINEFVQSAIDTYTKNFPETNVLIDDIKKYDAEDFLEKSNLQVGELDILDGSPPCSAFSVSGKREKGWDKEKKYSDGKVQVSIENLFYEFIRIADGIKPKVIVAENVKGITLGESKRKLNAFINEFEKIGYYVTYKVLNAADYGVPQARERTIFICVREDVADSLGLSFLNLNSIFPEATTKERVSMGEALSDIENDPDEVNMLLDYLENSWQKKFVDPMPFNPKKTLKASDKMFIETNPKKSCFNMKRPSPNNPSPTLTQMGQARGSSGVLHFSENRKLTVVECKRLMGFPEDFVLTGTFDQQVERLGRAVAPLMYKEVSKRIYETIIFPYNQSR